MGQHKSPQEYLRHFGISPDRRIIWQFDTTTLKYSDRPIPIKNAAQARNFYSPEDEKMLAELIEAPARAPLNKLRARESVTREERAKVAWYINAMVRRGPRSRNHMLEILPTEFDAYRKRLLANLDQYIEWSGRSSTDWINAIEYLSERIRNGEVSDKDDLVNSQYPVGKLALAVFHMQWVIVHTKNSGEFITNDNPVYFTEGIGLGNQRAELTFPLSPYASLHASWRGKEWGLKHMDATQNQLVKEINRRTVYVADRMLYSHRTHDWIAAVSSKRPNVALKYLHFGLPEFTPVKIPDLDK